ncbi:secreted and transmembrane protein 1 isoform 3-T9 [Hipposideros larvatus]
MLSPAPSLPVMLWALLLIPASLGVQTGTWDKHTCTEGVSVSRGERAVMTCNLSSPISYINICLVRSGGDCQTIFKSVSPGNYSEGGWQLWIQEDTAQLVTEKAQDSQAGQYLWRIAARQISIKNTTLNISGPEMLFTLPEAMPQAQRRDPIIVPSLVILFVILFVILGFFGVFWHRRCPFTRLQELPQESQI